MAKKTKESKGAGGRPSKYSEKIAELICTEIMAGCSVQKICARNGFPVQQTVYTWLLKYPEFLEMYTIATHIREDNLADEILDIADDDSNDMYEGDKGSSPNSAAVKRSDLRVRARMWHVAKIHPKKYRDSNATEVTTTGGAPINPVQIYIPSNGREKNKEKK